MTEGGGGDCFSVAARQVLTLDDPDLILVHGLVWADGSGTAPKGYHPHAWVERTIVRLVPVGDDPTAEPVLLRFVECIDRSNGHDVTLGQGIYYRAGMIDAARCRYYTHVEARRLIDAHGHWGPWEDEDNPAT